MTRLLILLCSFLLAMPLSVMAKKPGQGKGQGPSPNQSAYEHASDNAKFKRGDDWQGGHNKADDGEYEDDDHGKKYQDKDRDRDKKKKGKHDDDDTDDDSVDDGGKKKMKKSGEDKGKN